MDKKEIIQELESKPMLYDVMKLASEIQDQCAIIEAAEDLKRRSSRNSK